jgi:signal transduction histidine kinase
MTRGAARGERILVVDSEDAGRAELARLVRQLGYQVAEAATAAEAAADKIRHGTTDAALVAVRGHGAADFSRLAELRRLRPDFPVVAVIEGGTANMARDAMDYGAAGVLRRPLTAEAAAVVLHQALHGAPAAGRHAELEDRLRHCQQLIVTGQLACGFAHDLNNLLTVVLGFNTLQLRQLGERHPLRMPAEEIHRAATQAAVLARRLLNLSRPEAEAPVNVDLNALLRDMEKMLCHLLRDGIRFELAFDPALSPVRADPARLEQVILNLLLNARDAMSYGGTLTVTTANRTVDAGMPLNGLPPPGAYVVLTVSDTGTGIDAATLPHVFEPFFTTKSGGKGTGLGLAVVADVAREYGGHVRVRSALGQGATFSVYLPRAMVSDDDTPRPVAMAALSHPPGRETVLVVEDHPGVRTLATEVLRRQGYAVLEAKDSEEALEICQNRPGPIHLALADVNLPKMSGLRLGALVRQLHPGVKVLYISGDLPGETALGPGEGFLAKPFTPETLLRAVRALLEERRTTGNGTQP